MDATRVVEKLKFARNLLKKRGWAKTWEDEYGKVCAVASVRLAYGGVHGTDEGHGESEAVQYLTKRLRENTSFSEIPSWNDAATTSEEDVLRFFDEAIAELEAEV